MLGERNSQSTVALATISALSFIGLGGVMAVTHSRELLPVVLAAIGAATATLVLRTAFRSHLDQPPDHSPPQAPPATPPDESPPPPVPSPNHKLDLFSHAFETLPLGLAILTARDGCFLEVNSRFLQLTGHDKSDVISLTDEELGLWENNSVREQFRARMSTDGTIKGAPCQLRNKQGALVNRVVSLLSVEVQNTPCLILTVQDPEEFSQLEARILETRKMEAVGQLAAGLAHDFNNILMIVQGYTSLLLSDKEMDRSSNEALEQVSVAADRAAQLTRQLLTFSRKQIIHPKTVQLNATLDGMRDILVETLGPKINLSIELSNETPQIEADPAVMEEGIMSLALNARETLANGGDIRITTAQVEIDGSQARTRPEARSGTFACLTIQDSGPGMDAATASRIFEPFFTTKEVGHGSGLGLATVYGIVKQHNGWIEVISEPERGTSFQIYLPASTKTLSQEPRPADSIRLAGKEHILVVEDEPGLRALVQGILNRFGYQVATASHGTEALTVWQEHGGEFDLLLTDMIMPEGLSGRELAQKLWVEKPDLKVIFTSGYSVDLLADDTGAFVEGVNFIQKPYRPGELAATLRRCLGPSPLAETSA